MMMSCGIVLTGAAVAADCVRNNDRDDDEEDDHAGEDQAGDELLLACDG